MNLKNLFYLKNSVLTSSLINIFGRSGKICPNWSHFVLIPLLIILISPNASTQCLTIGGGAGSIGAIPASFSPPPSGPLYVRVYIHTLRKIDGTISQTNSDLDKAFAILRTTFSPYNIFFVRGCDIQSILVSDQDYLNPDVYCNFWTDPQYLHNDGIDIFMGPNDYVGEGATPNIPSKTIWITGTEWSSGIPSILGTTLAHELGHCLGLWHTFHGTLNEHGPVCGFPEDKDSNQCCELVNGSNGSSCGDYVADTEADPREWKSTDCSTVTLKYDAASMGCAKTADPLTDLNGDIYTPPIHNTMSYQTDLQCIIGFTNGQGDRMRQVISLSPILQACLVQPDITINPIIANNTTWTTLNTPNNGNFYIYGNLEILSGATLTISTGVTVHFGQENNAIIHPNGRMILNGTLTGLGCTNDVTWQGVQVWGSLASQSQYPVSGIYAQGRFVGQPGSRVENAKTAIQLYGPTASLAGGQISCNQTTFSNNVNGIVFSNYLNFWPFSGSQQGQPRNYLGTFNKCTFITDDHYVDPEPFYSFVNMTGVNGINLTGCTFTNSRTINGNDKTNWGYGIHATDAGFSVIGSGNGSSYPPPSYTYSEFNGLGDGIYVSTAFKNRPYIVQQCNFNKCYTGMTLLHGSESLQRVRC